jgi:hypothetical protein
MIAFLSTLPTAVVGRVGIGTSTSGRVCAATPRSLRWLFSSASVIGGPLKTTAAQILPPRYSSGNGTLRPPKSTDVSAGAPPGRARTPSRRLYENALFSDPTDWSSVSLAERRDALARTDRGVLSARVQDALLADDRIRHLRGRVAHAVAGDERIRLTLSTSRGREHLETVHGFDLVVDGSGADALWFVPLFGQDALDLLELGLGGPLTGDALQEAIGHDLAVAGVTPKLFLPGLSGLTQGPGFPNLSCLGLLSDRILGADYQAGAARDRSIRRSDEHQPIR